MSVVPFNIIPPPSASVSLGLIVSANSIVLLTTESDVELATKLPVTVKSPLTKRLLSTVKFDNTRTTPTPTVFNFKSLLVTIF